MAITRQRVAAQAAVAYYKRVIPQAGPRRLESRARKNQNRREAPANRDGPMSLSEFVNSPKGRPMAFAFAALAVLVTGYFVWTSLGGSDAAVSSTDRVFICSETGKQFRYTIKLGDMTPLRSPYSGKDTGYPTEECYWTADAKPKKEPTYVLLNQTVGKPGPTFCPDCKRLVIPLNPPASESGKAPPTEQEYKAAGGRPR